MNKSKKECYICGKLINGEEKLCSSCQIFSDGNLIFNMLPFHLLSEIEKEDVIEMLKNPEIIQLINKIYQMSYEKVQDNLSSLTIEAFEKVNQLENKEIIPTANLYFQAFLDFISRAPKKKRSYEENVQKVHLEIRKGDLLPKFEDIIITQEDLDIMISSYKPYYSLSYFQLFFRVKSPVLKIIFGHIITLQNLLSQFRDYFEVSRKRDKVFQVINEIERALEKLKPFMDQLEQKVKNADKGNLLDIINKMKK